MTQGDVEFKSMTVEQLHVLSQSLALHIFYYVDIHVHVMEIHVRTLHMTDAFNTLEVYKDRHFSW